MPSKVEKYAAIGVFVKIAEAGSFTHAGKSLGLSTSQVSRTLAALENQMGVRLVNRSTRRFSLTEPGKRLYERCRGLLGDVDEAVESVREEGGELRGTLRITTPVQFGLRYLNPVVTQFALAHPGLRLEMNYDDRRVDLVASGVDVAVRIAQLADTSLIARKLGSVRTRTLASPAYLEAHGTPQHPSELAQHDCLVTAIEGAGTTWRFSGNRDVVVKVRDRLVSNNVEGLLPFAVAGLGIARVPEAVLCGELKAGTLVPILEAWDQRTPVQAVYTPGRNQSQKVRRFVDFLVQEFAGAPWSCG